MALLVIIRKKIIFMLKMVDRYLYFIRLQKKCNFYLNYSHYKNYIYIPLINPPRKLETTSPKNVMNYKQLKFGRMNNIFFLNYYAVPIICFSHFLDRYQRIHAPGIEFFGKKLL